MQNEDKITNVIARIGKAEILCEVVGQIQRNKDGSYSVGSQFVPEICYRVDLVKNECNCPDHFYRGVICKHILACKQLVAQSLNERTS
jgi:SWIM zinc finger